MENDRIFISLVKEKEKKSGYSFKMYTNSLSTNFFLVYGLSNPILFSKEIVSLNLVRGISEKKVFVASISILVVLQISKILFKSFQSTISFILSFFIKLNYRLYV